MIRALTNFQKTSSYYWTPWTWTTDPFPAFRGEGAVHRAFLAVVNGFTPWFLGEELSISDDTSAVIKTKKGGLLLVPRRQPADEHILLVSAKSAFRGGFSRLEVFGGEILLTKRSAKHCYEIIHLVVRLTDPNGYVMTETGDCNRRSYGEVDIFSWRGGHFTLPTKEYEAAAELGQLFATHDDIQQLLKDCQERHAAEAASLRDRKALLPRLEAVNATLRSCKKEEYALGSASFTRTEWSRTVTYLYNEEDVAVAEKKAATALREKAQREAYEQWRPQFAAVTAQYTFAEEQSPWHDSVMDYCSNLLSFYDASTRKHVYYEYSQEDLDQFILDAPRYEASYQERLHQKAVEEAAEAARKKAEEEARLAREAAEQVKAEREAAAKALGLPSNIRIWHRDGRTNAGKAWVISDLGMDRECDFVDTMVCGSNSKRFHQNYEGDHVWNQILPGELVIEWRHAYTAAPHRFIVVHRPETLTAAQLERVAEIQLELDEEFDGLTGLVSGDACPAVCGGWLELLA